MMFISHLLFGVLWALLALALEGPTIDPLIQLQQISLVVLGAVIPDIDEPESYVGRRLLPLSLLINSPGEALRIARKILSRLKGETRSHESKWVSRDHRGLTHSLLGAMALGLVLPSRLVDGMGAFIFLGWMSHLVADMLTPSGIPLFYPIQKRVASPLRVKTGSPSEYVLFTLPIVIAILSFLYYMGGF